MTEPAEAYNRGFDDGLKWVAYCLRLAADQVEPGQTHFANQLRSVANEIETPIQKAKSDGPQT